jgi:hypothetical protein
MLDLRELDPFFQVLWLFAELSERFQETLCLIKNYALKTYGRVEV